MRIDAETPPTHPRGRLRGAGRLLDTPLIVALALLVLAVPLGASAYAEAPPESIAISEELRLGVRDGRDIELHVRPSDNDDYRSLAERLCANAAAADAIRAWNGRVAVDPSVWIRVPLPLLSADYRVLVLRSLFPEDRYDGEDWVHVARRGRLPLYNVGLWQVAEWFTGNGEHFATLQQANALTSPELTAGQQVRIPARLLIPALRLSPRSADGLLEYGADGAGSYAGYRLKSGEALYTSVVVRFTGRSGSEDVNALAAQIAERSGVRDARDIPVDYLIKIPFDVLEPDYLPPNHPRRLEAEAARAEMAEALAREPVRMTEGGLEGVVVVIDPGHGGADPGTHGNGIWERDHVYDVACRLKQKLERYSAAQVVMTLKNAQNCTIQNKDKLPAFTKGEIQTDPPFVAGNTAQARVGVNLRWYLANSIMRDAVKRGVSADRIVFLSIHADSRHPSLRGTMVYVPGAKYRARTYAHNSKTYRRFSEVREKSSIKFSRKSRVRSEAISQKLAKEIVASFRQAGLPVQKHQPIRNRVIRGKGVWVPAVIRANAIPAKVLVELLNLPNPKDAALMASARERDRMAGALFDSLFGYFGEEPPELQAARP
ncbi:hypothetical protein ABI59_06395 [Acidobacteria bacterium Mor1]|nr:hypothetical protein ABI59_06395 [Acidobacteria bacterium Mor1]